MLYKRFEHGRTLLEILTILALVGILSLGLLAGYNYAMAHHKANEVLDYINRVFLVVKSVGEDDYSYISESANGDFECEEIVPSMPPFIYSCGAIRKCEGNGKSCITRVFAYFEDGERLAAAVLENKLGLTVRDKRPNKNRVFEKASCVDDAPIECSHGFSPCASKGGSCSTKSREFTIYDGNGNPTYSDDDCETNGSCWNDQ